MVGNLLHFDTEGISFVMTSMFVVIFLEQWKKEKHHISAYIGLGASILCLLIFGPDSFLLPTMTCILVVLTAFQKPLKKKSLEK